MKWIIKRAVTPIKEFTGSIIDSTNITDKTTNTYSANVIDQLIPKRTSDIINDSNFITADDVPDSEIPAQYNYSTPAPDGTIDDLAAFTVGKPGITGSVNITKKASGTGSNIPAGWYNFIAMPHRTGLAGETTSDNPDYGSIILTPMTFSGASWILRRTSNKTAITEVKPISTLSYADFVVSAHQISVSLSAYNSSNYTRTFTKAGYYPLCIAGPAAYSYNQGGFTMTPQRLSARSVGSCTLAYWGKNDANGATSNCTAYVDILWVKV